MQYIITGSTGFLGSYIVDKLTSLGDSVIALYNSTHPVPKCGVTYVQCDITNSKSIRCVCDKYSNADGVFHCAVLMDVRESMINPLNTHSLNVSGTINLLDAVRNTDIKRFVYPSSAAVYGNNPNSPLSEDTKIHPESVYALSKYMGEEYVNAFGEFYGLSNVILRFFNLYGPYKIVRNAESFTSVIPLFIKKIMSGNEILVYGDGNQTRDYIYIDDGVSAAVNAMKSGAEGTFNIGSGIGTSINNVLNYISGFTNIKPNVTYCPESEGDLKCSVANISKASSEIGLSHSVSVEEGIRKTVEYYIQSKK